MPRILPIAVLAELESEAFGRRGRCSLCRRDFTADCQWCRGRAERLRAPDAVEAAAWTDSERLRGDEAAALASKARARIERLVALARPVRVGLVGCSKQKKAGTHPARELYSSPLFRLSFAIAWRT